MAFSKSIIRAQMPKPCELCETNTNVKCSCIQCNKYMCDQCKRIHLNTPTCAQHEVIDIKSVQARKDDFLAVATDNVPCKIHTRKLYCMFCQTCDILVCPECISSTHRKHELESMDKVCEEKLKNITTFRENISEQLADCKREKENLQQMKLARNLHYDEVMKKIDEREKEIQGELHKYADGLRSQVTNEKLTLNELVITNDKQLKTLENRLQSKCHELETVIESKQGEAIVSTELEIDGSLPDDSDKPLPNKLIDFLSGKFETSVIDNIFGVLKSINAPAEQLKHDFKVMKSYTTDLGSFDQLCILNHHEAWVRNTANQILLKICLDKQISNNKISLTGTMVFDMSRVSNNQILLSSFKTGEVKILTESGVIKPLFSLAPLLTRGIYITRNNDIIVGVRDSSDSFDGTKFNSKILLLQMDGTKKNCIEYDKHGKRLFTIPGRITTNVNNDMVVIDHISGSSSRVMVLGQGGDLKWIYQGNTKIIKTDKVFRAMGLMTTTTGNIIVTDPNCDALHVLSMSGELLSYRTMTEQGVICPISLDIDSNMQLWVGCNTIKGKSDAKIHILKMI